MSARLTTEREKTYAELLNNFETSNLQSMVAISDLGKYYREQAKKIAKKLLADEIDFNTFSCVTSVLGEYEKQTNEIYSKLEEIQNSIYNIERKGVSVHD